MLYAPDLKDIKHIATICSNVTRQVNVIIGIGTAHFTVEQLPLFDMIADATSFSGIGRLLTATYH